MPESMRQENQSLSEPSFSTAQEEKFGGTVMDKLAITLFNRKGGTGKTTIAAILAQLAINDKKRVVMYDLDEQQNLTDTLADVGNFDVRHEIKKEDETENTDIFILDCPPALNEITVEAIAFADIVLIPVRPDRYSMSNLEIIYREVEKVGKIRHQAALIKNAFSRTMITSQIDEVIHRRGFPVAGRLPQNQWIVNNIAMGAPWYTGMSQDQQEPFLELYRTILHAFKKMLKGNIKRMWK